MSFVNFAEARRHLDIMNTGVREKDFADAVRAEADGSATWARWAPGVTPTGADLNLQVDVAAAIAADFVAS